MVKVIRVEVTTSKWAKLRAGRGGGGGGGRRPAPALSSGTVRSLGFSSLSAPGSRRPPKPPPQSPPPHLAGSRKAPAARGGGEGWKGQGRPWGRRQRHGQPQLTHASQHPRGGLSPPLGSGGSRGPPRRDAGGGGR